jgi:hypothetical protein
LEVHAWVDGAVVGVVDDDEPAVDCVEVVVVVGVVVVVVDGSDAAVVEDEPDAAVVDVVPVLWAPTECSGTTVRAATAPPVVTAVPKAATNALLLMAPSVGASRQRGLDASSDDAPNP